MEACPHIQVDKQGLMVNRPESSLPKIEMETVLGEFLFGVSEGLHEDLPLETPFGTLDGTLAIILAPSAEYYANEDGSQIKDGSLPSRLDKAGVTSENSLVWPLDFGAIKKLASDDVLDSSLLYKSGSKLSWALLDASAAEVVILCGELVQASIFPAGFKQDVEFLKLNFENRKVNIWIAMSNQAVERVYIATPDLEGGALARSWVLK